jgi:hypothetical protein
MDYKGRSLRRAYVTTSVPSSSTMLSTPESGWTNGGQGPQFLTHQNYFGASPAETWSSKSGPMFSDRDSNTLASRPSRDTEFAPFFGMPSKPDVPDPYDAYDMENFQLPDGFVGPRPYLKYIILKQVTAAEQFPYREMAPFVRNDHSQEVAWDVWMFNSHMLGRTPEESVSRLLTMQQTSSKESMVRFGIALMLEHGFMKTPKGRENYRRNLDQIAAATATTLAYGAMYACLNTKYTDPNNKYRMQRSRNLTQMGAIFREELSNWAIIQKTEDGWKTILDKCKQTLMQRNNKYGNYTVVPAGMEKYLAGRPENKYYMYNGIPGGQRTDLLPHTGALKESIGYRIGEHQPNDDPTIRERTIGGFFHMTAQHLADVPDLEYTTDMMNTRIFSEIKDDWHMMRYAEMVENLGLFDFDQESIPITEHGDRFFGSLTKNSTWGEYLQQAGEKSLRRVLNQLANLPASKQSEFISEITAGLPSVEKAFEQKQGANKKTAGQQQQTYSPPSPENPSAPQPNGIELIVARMNAEISAVKQGQLKPIYDVNASQGSSSATNPATASGSSSRYPKQLLSYLWDHKVLGLGVLGLAGLGLAAYTFSPTAGATASDSTPGASQPPFPGSTQSAPLSSFPTDTSSSAFPTASSSWNPSSAFPNASSSWTHNTSALFDIPAISSQTYSDPFSSPSLGVYSAYPPQGSYASLNASRSSNAGRSLNASSTGGGGDVEIPNLLASIEAIIPEISDASVAKRAKQDIAAYTQFIGQLANKSTTCTFLLRDLFAVIKALKIESTSDVMQLLAVSMRAPLATFDELAVRNRLMFFQVRMTELEALMFQAGYTDTATRRLANTNSPRWLPLDGGQPTAIYLPVDTTRNVDNCLLLTETGLAFMLAADNLVLFRMTDESLASHITHVTSSKHHTQIVCSDPSEWQTDHTSRRRFVSFQFSITVSALFRACQQAFLAPSTSSDDEQAAHSLAETFKNCIPTSSPVEAEADIYRADVKLVAPNLEILLSQYYLTDAIHTLRDIALKLHEPDLSVDAILDVIKPRLQHLREIVSPHRAREPRHVSGPGSDFEVHDRSILTREVAWMRQQYPDDEAHPAYYERTRAKAKTEVTAIVGRLLQASATNTAAIQGVKTNLEYIASTCIDQAVLEHYKSERERNEAYNAYEMELRIAVALAIMNTEKVPHKLAIATRYLTHPKNLNTERFRADDSSAVRSIAAAIIAENNPQLTDKQRSTIAKLNEKVQAVVEFTRKAGQLAYTAPSPARVVTLQAPSALTVEDARSLLFDCQISSGRFVRFALNNNIGPLFGILNFRPHKRYMMGTMLHMNAYGEAAKTFYGFADFQLADNVAQKEHYGHFTMYAKTIVTRPEMIVRGDNIICKDYIGGNDHRVWNMLSEDHVDAYRSNELNCDIFPAACSPEFVVDTQFMDITGRFNERLSPNDEAKKATYYGPMANVLSQVWGWRAVSSPLNREHFSAIQSKFNTLVFQEKQWRYNPKTKQFDDAISDKGHFGQYVFPGCAEARRGNGFYFRNPDLAQVTVVAS